MPSDAACDGRIKLRSLLNYFQDTAGLAVEDIEGTTTELLSRGYAWVLTKYEIDFHGGLPKLDETFTISTFHDPNHGYNTLRMFQVYSGEARSAESSSPLSREDTGVSNHVQGSMLVSAKTSWLLVDVRTGRPVKPVAHIPGITSRDNQDISPEFTEIPDVTNVTHTAEFPAMFHDTDINGHVNNAAYFEWVYDSSPVELTACELVRVCASFRSGARLGEKVSLEFSKDGNVTCCRVMRPGMSKPGASFLCEWRSANA